MNKAIESSPQVFKKIIRNPKILDLRGIELPSWSEPDHYADNPDQDRYIYKTAKVCGRQWLFDAVADSYYVCRNFGYFFFDYEKALANVANINQIVDARKIEKYGIPLDYDKFRVTKVVLSRKFGGADSQQAHISWEVLNAASDLGFPALRDDDDEKQSIMFTEDSTSLDSNTFIILFTAGDSSGSGVEGVSGPEEGCRLGWTSDDLFPYVMPRSWMPVNGGSRWDSDYRLMCFEFQDIMDGDLSESFEEKYYITITIEDTSIEDLVALKAEAVTAKNSYNEDFIELAEADTPLSYDVTTGLFNEYFSDGITAIYEDDSPNAPWNRAPLLYHIFSDLFYDTFDGDIDKIIEETLIVVNSINPTNGNYYAAKKFAEELDVFWDEAFSSSGANLANAINLLSNAGMMTKTFEQTITITTNILQEINM